MSRLILLGPGSIKAKAIEISAQRLANYQSLVTGNRSGNQAILTSTTEVFLLQWPSVRPA